MIDEHETKARVCHSIDGASSKHQCKRCAKQAADMACLLECIEHQLEAAETAMNKILAEYNETKKKMQNLIQSNRNKLDGR